MLTFISMKLFINNRINIIGMKIIIIKLQRGDYLNVEKVIKVFPRFQVMYEYVLLRIFIINCFSIMFVKLLSY